MCSWDGKHYKSNSEAQKERSLRFLETTSFKGDEVVLDIGCGDGKITNYIAKKVPKGLVIGIDSSHSMIEEATKEYRNTPNLRFIHAGAESFTSDMRFDLATSFNALHWVKDHNLVLKNVRTMLKPGGQLLFLMASGRRNRYVDQVLSQKEWKPYFQKLDAFHDTMEGIDYRKLLKTWGFSEQLVEVKEEPYSFEDIESMVENVMSWLPAMTDLPRSTCQKLAEEISAKAVEDNNGDKVLSFSMLYVKASI